VFGIENLDILPLRTLIDHTHTNGFMDIYSIEQVGLMLGELGSSVSIVSGYGLGHRVREVRSPAEAKRFFL
jgi:hypothetical protein